MERVKNLQSNSRDSVESPRTAVGAWFKSLTQGFIYDEFGIKTDFKAKVLARPIFTTGKETNLRDYESAKFMYKARILGNPSPHDYLPDPCDASRALDENEALREISFHTTFISDTDLGSAAYTAPKIGDIVNVRLEPGRFSYNLQNGAHLGILNLNNAIITEPDGEQVENEICETLIELFGTGEIESSELRDLYGRVDGTTGGYGRQNIGSRREGANPTVGRAAQSGVEFYNRLRASPHFEGFSNNFLIGLMSNAGNESGFNFSALAGDCTGGDNSLQIQGRRLKCCSFGYWQLNVCGGEGIQYIRWLNSSRTNGPRGVLPAGYQNYNTLSSDQAKFNRLVNDEYQFAWVAWRMKQIFTRSDPANWNDTQHSPQAWAGWIADIFENCVGCQSPSGSEYLERREDAANFAAGDLSDQVDTGS
tara:strand:+ start:705 stop:1970 length:1266 start_codon:yes stop_codon:yes gene_type:complete